MNSESRTRARAVVDRAIASAAGTPIKTDSAVVQMAILRLFPAAN